MLRGFVIAFCVLLPLRPFASITCTALSAPFLALYANAFILCLSLEVVSRGGEAESEEEEEGDLSKIQVDKYTFLPSPPSLFLC